jgi:N-acyl-D-aspartate/D-glutamate deacylase
VNSVLLAASRVRCSSARFLHRFRLAASTQSGDSVDILVRGGTVYDGSGTAGRVTDVGIRADRIVFVGDAAQSGVTAARVIEARGLIVAPGFIDPSMASVRLVRDRRNVPLMQGVTTVTIGPDGRGRSTWRG